MKGTVVVIALIILAWLYIAYVRPYLKSLPSMAQVWRSEETTWAAIKAYIDGRKTILIGVWGELIAMAPDALQAASGFDLKTLLGLPEHWAAYVTALLPVLMTLTRSLSKPQS